MKEPESSVAQFLWIGGRLSTLEELCLQSFLNVGYVVHLYVYDDVEHVPAGVVLQDASTILPVNRIFRYKAGFGKGSVAGFADLFRYHLLAQKGGWWFDTDFVAIRSPESPGKLRFASTWEGVWGACASNCAIWAPANHEVMCWLVAESEALVSKQEVGFGETGPLLAQKAVKVFGIEKSVAPWREFCPIPWRMIHQVAYRNRREAFIQPIRLLKHLIKERLDPQFKAGRISSQTRALHLHNEIWSSRGLSKDSRYHFTCLYERLKRRHLSRRPPFFS